ncbi:hypothetical protein AB0E04_48765, partial [Streptomyces sp. NPDC048251]
GERGDQRDHAEAQHQDGGQDVGADPRGGGTPSGVTYIVFKDSRVLLSDRASFVAGSHHLVDGGYTAIQLPCRVRQSRQSTQK